MLILAASSLLGWILAREQVPQTIARAFLEFSDSKIVFLILVNILLLFLGAIIEPTSALVISVPVLMPVAIQVGVEPIQFGVIVVLNLMIGLLTPPIGGVLFVLSSVTKIPVAGVFRGVAPFLVPLLAVLLAVTFIPQVSLWLPERLGSPDDARRNCACPGAGGGDPAHHPRRDVAQPVGRCADGAQLLRPGRTSDATATWRTSPPARRAVRRSSSPSRATCARPRRPGSARWACTATTCSPGSAGSPMRCTRAERSWEWSSTTQDGSCHRRCRSCSPSPPRPLRAPRSVGPSRMPSPPARSRRSSASSPMQPLVPSAVEPTSSRCTPRTAI